MASTPAAATASAGGFHPRPADEWQGMLVPVEPQGLCREALSCGAGLACRDGRCGACAADGDCAQGEQCVLDHCVPAGNARCRSRRDCGAEELCVLSGVSPDARGNAGMRAGCLPPTGGSPDVAAEAPVFKDLPPSVPSRAIQAGTLLESVRAAARESSSPAGR